MAIDYSPNTQRDEAIVIAGLAGLIGLGLVLFGLKGGGQHGLRSDETMDPPIAPGLRAGGMLQLALGAALKIVNPTVVYAGNGRNAYAYLQIKQDGVTVYGSGIAALFLPPQATPATLPLVPANEIQCQGTPGAILSAYPFPGTDPCGATSVPICGRAPKKGPADVYLEIYQDQNESGNPTDGIGYAPSPTCSNPPRVPVRFTQYPNAVVFV